MSVAKDIRKQLKNVVQAELKTVLDQELTGAIRKELKAHIDARLDAIAKHMKDSLDTMDQRSKDIQAYILRQSK